MGAETAAPVGRAVVLGASNVARCITTLLQTACVAAGGPLDVLVGAGHGRSYGCWSWVLGRGLPAIVDCGLWRDLAARPALPLYALVTDVGNDILYDRPVADIAGWVETCLQRLREQSGRIVITGVPLSSIARLGTVRYLTARTILFPRSRLPLDVALERAAALDQQLRRLARNYEAHWIEPRRQWYGIDTIHVTQRSSAHAWREIFQAWNSSQRLPIVHGNWRQWLSLKPARPLHRTLFGISQRRVQPAVVQRDGTTVSFY